MDKNNKRGQIAKNIQLEVNITQNDIIIDFGEFKVITSKGYIENVKNVYWDDGCVMFETEDDLESIGIEHILYGEPPFNTGCDFKLVGIDILSKRQLKEYIGRVDSVRWQINEQTETSDDCGKQ